MAAFYGQVYEVVKRIPRGKVLTYKQVAKLAGSPGASRAVGTAMKLNPDMSIIPCHRVVGSDGKMHGYANGGEAEKVRMLREEGAIFKRGKVDLDRSGWKSLNA